jgi:hypothetical protein
MREAVLLVSKDENNIIGSYQDFCGRILAQFFSQNFRQDSRQVCRPSAEIADKLMLYFTK